MVDGTAALEMRVSFLSLIGRALTVMVVVVVAFFRYLGRRLVAGRLTKEQREFLRGEVAALALQRLGATFVKFGQILSTRPDLFGPGYTSALARLQDDVAPIAEGEIRAVLTSELGDAMGSLTIDWNPLAAASVAQVHRATLRREDGTEHAVVLKVQRPKARRQVARDLRLMAVFARLAHLLPPLRTLSMPGAVARFAEAMEGQLDFRQEKANNERFAQNFANTEGVRVPRIEDALSTGRVLCMEFVEGVRATEVAAVGGDRQAIARRGLHAILQMVFQDGFVHADLHPGNIVLTSDGDVVFIDLGLVAEIDDAYRGPWIQTFVALTTQDGALAARLFYGYAPTVGPRIDYAAFEAEVQGRFDALRGKPLSELEASKVLMGMMNVLRRHRVQVDPVFTVVNLAMLVAEGLGKQLDPDLDLIGLATPYLATALASAPPALKPRRPFPDSTA